VSKTLSCLFTSFYKKKIQDNHLIFCSLDENLPLRSLFSGVFATLCFPSISHRLLGFTVPSSRCRFSCSESPPHPHHHHLILPKIIPSPPVWSLALSLAPPSRHALSSALSCLVPSVRLSMPKSIALIYLLVGRTDNLNSGNYFVKLNIPFWTSCIQSPLFLSPLKTQITWILLTRQNNNSLSNLPRSFKISSCCASSKFFFFRDANISFNFAKHFAVLRCFCLRIFIFFWNSLLVFISTALNICFRGVFSVRHGETSVPWSIIFELRDVEFCWETASIAIYINKIH